MSVKMTINIFKLIDESDGDIKKLKHTGLSTNILKTLLEDPATWQMFISQRTSIQPEKRSDIVQFDEDFAKKTDLSEHQIQRVIKELELYAPRPKAAEEREQKLKEYYTYRRDLADLMYPVIHGTKNVNEVVKASGINERTFYRRMMAAVEEVRPNIYTKKQLNQMSAESRKAIAELVRFNEYDKWNERKLALLSEEEKEEILKQS